jgi:peptidase inhibitor family I36
LGATGQSRLVETGRTRLAEGRARLAGVGRSRLATAGRERLAEAGQSRVAELGRAALTVAGQVRPGPRVRGAIGVASLLTVAIVPGAAMAAGAITVAADAYCTYGSFCLYSGPNFNGAKVEYSRDQLFCQDSKPALDVRSVLPGGARSVVNNTRTATTGLGVKIYSSPGNLVLTTVSPGGEVRDLDGNTAQATQSLCAFPK